MRKRPSLEPVFGLSILGYCRNIAAQHGGLHERGPAPYVDMKGSFYANTASLLLHAAVINEGKCL